jgi:hypothetical protein
MLLEAETGQCVCERRTSNELTKSDKTNWNGYKYLWNM